MNKEMKNLIYVIISIILVCSLYIGLIIGDINKPYNIAFQKDHFIDYFYFSKTILFHLLGSILFSVEILHIIKKGGKIRGIKTVYWIGILIFCLVSLISTFQAEYKEQAIIGQYYRFEGMMVTLWYCTLCIVVGIIIEKASEMNPLLKVLGIITIIISIHGTLQEFGYFIFSEWEWLTNLVIPEKYSYYRESFKQLYESGIIYGTLGNRNYAGSYGAMVVPLFITLTVLSNDKWYRIGYGVVSFFAILLLIGSRSSAGLVGAGTSLIVVLIIGSRIIWHHRIGLVKVGVILLVSLGIINLGMDEKLTKEIGNITRNIGILLEKTQKDFDYKDYLPIRNITLVENKVIIERQKGKIHIAYDQGKFLFKNEEGKEVPVIHFDNKYIVASHNYQERINFEEIAYRRAIEVGNDYRFEEVSPVLVCRIDKREIFYIDFSESQKPYLLNQYTDYPMIVEDAPSIGFKGKERVASGRGYIWSRSLPMLKDTWLIGNGPDTYAYYFPQNDFFGKWYGLGNPMIVVDKPHSLYLQYAINNGGLALIGFLMLVGYYIFESIKLYKSKLTYTYREGLGIGLLLAVVGYLGAGFFNDSVVSVAPIFWILLGSGIAINRINNTQEKRDVSIG